MNILVYSCDDEFLRNINVDEVSSWRRRLHDYHIYPKAPNACYGWGIENGAGQPKKPVWPEPLTELGRKYVKELKARKRAEKLAGTGVGIPQVDHH